MRLLPLLLLILSCTPPSEVRVSAPRVEDDGTVLATFENHTAGAIRYIGVDLCAEPCRERWGVDFMLNPPLAPGERRTVADPAEKRVRPLLREFDMPPGAQWRARVAVVR